MSLFSFSKESAAFDVTPIENEFLMEFMPSAPEAALRVYLYARMLCLHPEMGELADMAKALRMDEDELMEAFRYWEQRGLVEKLSDRPPRFELRSMRNVNAADMMDLEFYRYAELHAALNELFGVDKLKNRHYETAVEWMELGGLTQEAVLEIVKYERQLPGGKTPEPVFKRAQARVLEWGERGVHTLEEVRQAIALEDRARRTAEAVFEQLAIRREITKDELKCVVRWIGEWNLTTEDVLAACAQTTKSRNPTIAYLDAILKTAVERGSGARFDALKDVLRELNAANPTPTPEQLNAYSGYLSRGFEPETVRLAAVQSARRNKNRFEDLEWMLDAWDDMHIHTCGEAQAYIQDMQKKTGEMGAIMKAAGVARRPNMADLSSYEGWREKHSPELIRCAAELARGAREPVKYMDRLLANWAQAGIVTPEAARAAGANAAKGAATAAKRQSYLQHEYSSDDFGRDFFYDLSGDQPKEGEEQ